MTGRHPTVAVVGGGPAGLAAAERLAAAGASVTVYERLPTLARKFLMAGRGGLNLTHSEPLETFINRYGVAADWLDPMIRAMAPDHLRAWAEALGQETFVGTSGRIFPRAMKASPLLRAWVRRLSDQGVEVRLRHTWCGFAQDGALRFTRDDGSSIDVRADATLLALGGASWPRLGSDGRWTGVLGDLGIAMTPLSPSNVGVLVDWSEHMRRHAGAPLKRIAVGLGARSVRGEAVVTRQGLEGGAIYALSSVIRDALSRGGPVDLRIDLRPDVTAEALAAKLAEAPVKQSLATRLIKAARLQPAASALLREAHEGAPPRDPDALAAAIKAVPVRVSGLAGFARAISTAGGIRRDAFDANLMLKALPGIFVAGEMLDWDAPTGGYLLQATFATADRAASGLLAWWADQAGPHRSGSRVSPAADSP